MIFPLILTLAAICQVAPASPSASDHVAILQRFKGCLKDALNDFRINVVKNDVDFLRMMGRVPPPPRADHNIFGDNSLDPFVIEPVDRNIEFAKPIEMGNLPIPPPFWGRQQTLKEKSPTPFNLFNVVRRAVYLNDTKVSWNEARNRCLDKKAHLAVIDSAETEIFLINFLKEHNVTRAWIGVHSLFGDNQWTTIKGDRLESLPYVHWGEHQPDNYRGNERCVVLNERGMNDLACDSEAQYICHSLG